MTSALRPLCWDERAWLHDCAVANFAELAPELPAPLVSHYDNYWTDPDREQIALLDGDRRIGFAMVRMKQNCIWELAEFYITPAHRRAGLGREAARTILFSKPGSWVLGVARRGNASAFWKATLHDADWLDNLTRAKPFYPAQSHSYSFTTHPTAQELKP